MVRSMSTMSWPNQDTKRKFQATAPSFLVFLFSFFSIFLLFACASVCLAEGAQAPASARAVQGALVAAPKEGSSPRGKTPDFEDLTIGYLPAALGVAMDQEHIRMNQFDFAEEGDPGYIPKSKYSVLRIWDEYLAKHYHGWGVPHKHVLSRRVLNSITTKEGTKLIFNLRRRLHATVGGEPIVTLYMIIPHLDPNGECRPPSRFLQYVASPDFGIPQDNHRIANLPDDFFTQGIHQEGLEIQNNIVCVHIGNEIYQFRTLIQRPEQRGRRK